MSRALKFRCWDKIGKKYYYNGNLDNGDVMVLGLEGILQFSSSEGTWHEGDFILEQFTGFTDSEKKELYENDIVSCCFYENKPETAKIEWSDTACGFTIAGYPFNIHGLHSVKVLGNIHEKQEAQG